MLHDVVSGTLFRTFGGQGCPACCECCVMIGNRLFSPPPHGLVQLSYSPHSHLQFTGQGLLLHSLTSLRTPTQFTASAPSGILHVLCLACLPPPQVVLHSVHGPHSSNSTGTSEGPTHFRQHWSAYRTGAPLSQVTTGGH